MEPPAAAPTPVKVEKESAAPKEAVASTSEKKTCTYSVKPCAQRRMDGYAHCAKHILEDPTAPFAQCEHVARNTSKRCSLPVPLKEPEPRYCGSHKLALGLVQAPNKKSPAKRDRSKPSKAGSGGGKPLIAVLAKGGIGRSSCYLAMNADAGDSDSASSAEESDGEEAPLSSSDSEEEAAYNAFLAEAAQDEPDVDILKESTFVTEEELVRRRQAKVRRLLRLYKAQFTRLRAVLKLRHRRLARERKRRAEAPLRKAKQEQEITLSSAVPQSVKPSLKDKVALSYHATKISKATLEKISVKTPCSAPNCSVRPLPCTKYCQAHILLEPNQKLFKPCTYMCLSGQPCNYPIMNGQEFCPAHLEKELRDAKKESNKDKEKVKSERKRKTTEKAAESKLQQQQQQRKPYALPVLPSGTPAPTVSFPIAATPALVQHSVVMPAIVPMPTHTHAPALAPRPAPVAAAPPSSSGTQ